MNSFNLEILTPDGQKFNSAAESITVKTNGGDVEILAGHADYFAALGTGRARIITGGERRLASVSGGFISVTHSGVRLVATTFEFAEDIDLERAKKAIEAANDRLSKATDDRATAILKAKIARAECRISVGSSK